MSYILDALRKSESERQQGKVPDLGQQVQLIHRPKRKPSLTGLWLGLILTVNTAVLAYVFWPGRQTTQPGFELSQQAAGAQVPGQETPLTAESSEGLAAGNERQPSPEVSPSETPQDSGYQNASEESITVAQALTDEPELNDLPTVIVPSVTRNKPLEIANYQDNPAGSEERVPHLVELPMSFQKSIPDLTFNSHVYASDPVARRVMINDHYLRIGESFDGIRVERINEDGVVLSKNGTRFRVGVVRDWKSPR